MNYNASVYVSSCYIFKADPNPLPFNRMCFFTSDAIHNKFRFIHQINVSYGGGGMLCSFDNNQLVDFFHFLKCNIGQTLPIKKAVFYPSQQLDKNGQKFGF